MKAPDRKPPAVYLLPAEMFRLIYGEEEKDALSRWVDIPPFPIEPARVEEHRDRLREAEFIFSGWGAPRLDEAFLERVPNLKAFFYAAGAIRGIVTDAFWRRNIPICSAWGANAVPVAEFTLAEITLSLKRTWHFIRQVRETRSHAIPRLAPGAFHSTVGLVSFGMIGRQVRERLRLLEVRVLVYDPFLSAAEAAAAEVELCPLEELFARADVVSLHSPLLRTTEGMITGRLLDSMKPNATLINTARGGLVNEGEMIEVLRRRPDLYAVLDVTWPEPPEADSPLYTLPNVVLTPHIAGSMDGECRRMAQWMVEEARRFILGAPLQWQITAERSALLA